MYSGLSINAYVGLSINVPTALDMLDVREKITCLLKGAMLFVIRHPFWVPLEICSGGSLPGLGHFSCRMASCPLTGANGVRIMA